MDQLLPVAPGGIGRFSDGPKHWRDIARGMPIVVTPPAVAPLSRTEIKQQVKMTPDITDEDGWIDRAILAAWSLVETDLNRTLVRTEFEMPFDQYGIERAMPVPRPPLISVTKLSSFDILTGAETTVDPGDYDLDTYSQPGRICLKTGKIWPVGVRAHLGGKLRWVAGYSGVPSAVTSITRAAAVATVTTTAPHGWSTGKRVTLAGADQADYNGTFEITVTGAATFTVPVANSPATPATGVLTATDLGIPARYLHAIALLVGHFDQTRAAVTGGTQRFTPDEVPLGYDALIGDRLEYLG